MTRAARAVMAVSLWLTIPFTVGCDLLLFCFPDTRTVHIGPGVPNGDEEYRRLTGEGWECERVFRSYTRNPGDGTYRCTKCG